MRAPQAVKDGEESRLRRLWACKLASLACGDQAVAAAPLQQHAAQQQAGAQAAGAGGVNGDGGACRLVIWGRYHVKSWLPHAPCCSS